MAACRFMAAQVGPTPSSPQVWQSITGTPHKTAVASTPTARRPTHAPAVVSSPTVSGTGPAQPVASAAERGKPASSELKPQAAVKAVEDILCTVAVVEGDPAKVLELLSRQTKTNLVVLSPPSGKLTLNLTNVRFSEMIQHICALTQLRYLRIGSTFILASEAQLKAAYPAEWNSANPEVAAQAPPQPVSKVYTASYVSAAKIADALNKLFDKTKLAAVGGPSQANPVVTPNDTSSMTGASPTTQTSYSGGTTQPGAAQGLVEKPSKVLILRGEAASVEEAYKLAEQMDTARPQVAIKVTIYDISNTALKQLGLSWTVGDVNLSEKPSGSVLFGSFTRAPQTFSAAVDALEEKDGARLLASPNITVLDGEQAYILIGDRINFPVLVGYSQAGSPIFNSQVENVGIYLQVVAAVGTDKSITLSLYPQVSSITGYMNVNGASYPQVSTREAQTTLRMQSGETMVLGGLLQDEDVTQMKRLPILSDLPIIGELFKHRSKSKTASQVIISIKPTLINVDEHR